jgi:putative transposon-encoded protein
MKVEIDNVEETITKTARIIGNSAHVLVPKKWAGRKVKVSLINELSPECIELAKRIDKARADVAAGKAIKLDVDNLEEMFES